MKLVNVFVMAGSGLIGLVGLAFASRAHDDGIYLFGLILFAFAIVMNFMLLKRHFDEVDAKTSH